jgi:hypothetical protein
MSWPKGTETVHKIPQVALIIKHGIHSGRLNIFLCDLFYISSIYFGPAEKPDDF